MKYPTDLRYTKEHEWARIEGKVATVGITSHAQQALGDIVFIDLPKTGRDLKQGETFGVVESIKAVSDLYAPVSGKVIETNAAVVSDLGLLASDPHGKGWLMKIEMSDPSQAGLLLDVGAYEALIAAL